MKLAVLATHPVQYNAPWFHLLTKSTKLQSKVFYSWHGGERVVVDRGFGREIQWNIPLTEGYEYEVVPPSVPNTKPGFMACDSPKIVSRLADWNPDSILVIGWNFRSHLRVMRKYSRTKNILFRGDSTLLTVSSSARAWVRKALLTYVYKMVDRALVVGTNNREYFLAHGLKEPQLISAPHAIDNVRFGEAFHDARALEIRKSIGLSDTDVTILFAGKLEPVKAPLDLVAAFAKAKLDRPELKLVIVGNGVLEESVREAIRNVPGVTMLPFQNQAEMPSVYRVGDVICLCSRLETWGLCINEAMASGRCVISSDCVGSQRDLVKDGITGWHFPAGDINSFSSTLKQLPSRSRLLEMGAECRKFIANWSFQGIVTAIEHCAEIGKYPQA